MYLMLEYYCLDTSFFAPRYQAPLYLEKPKPQYHYQQQPRQTRSTYNAINEGDVPQQIENFHLRQKIGAMESLIVKLMLFCYLSFRLLWQRARPW